MILHLLPAGTSVPTAVLALTDLLIIALAAIILGWSVYKVMGFAMAWLVTRRRHGSADIRWDHRGNPTVLENVQSK